MMSKDETMRVNISVNKADWEAAKILAVAYIPQATRQGVATVAFSKGLQEMRKEQGMEKVNE